MIYETQTMAHKQAHNFCKQFDQEIGTERELNDSSLYSGGYYVLCADLESLSEINACRRFEAAALKI